MSAKIESPSKEKPLHKNKKCNITTTFLGYDFYKDIKNEITYNKLEELSEKAKSIPQPILYGQFLNDAHYMETLDIVLNSTAETIHRGVFYLKHILPQLTRKHSVLDIGPGHGELTRLIGKEFKDITIVDTCDIAFGEIEKILHRTSEHLHLTKIHSNILGAELPDNHYDLAMVSHVLYYIDTAQWLEATQICYNSLHSGGIMVVVLSGAKLGKASLMQNFSGKAIDIDSYAEQCAKFSPSPVEVFVSNEKFYACDLNTILHIAGFLLHDVHTNASKEELTEYVLQNYKNDKNLFEISTQQEFIVIKKD